MALKVADAGALGLAISSFAAHINVFTIVKDGLDLGVPDPVPGIAEHRGRHIQYRSGGCVFRMGAGDHESSGLVRFFIGPNSRLVEEAFG